MEQPSGLPLIWVNQSKATRSIISEAVSLPFCCHFPQLRIFLISWQVPASCSAYLFIAVKHFCLSGLITISPHQLAFFGTYFSFPLLQLTGYLALTWNAIVLGRLCITNPYQGPPKCPAIHVFICFESFLHIFRSCSTGLTISLTNHVFFGKAFCQVSGWIPWL